ncbi:MAG: bifunctional adenosylcobinamide kinase/adenosylcobinamide-phosphate guanylyltransferase [Firmicutes bacterium]|nr:bifunctional adenosylcobinamide kinase/adenosylcobinamide-phosphate guanylyltransferase [Bacillota bacterium]
MVFIIGGKAQGKLDYALQTFFKGRMPDEHARGGAASPEDLSEAVLISDLQEYIRRYQKNGHCELPAFRRDAVVLCEETGSGVIPMEQAERDFREAVGRAGCRIAAQADRVIVLRFGIPQRIK